MTIEAERGRDPSACVLYGATGVASDSGDLPCRSADELLAAGANIESPSVLLVDATLVERIGDARMVPDVVVIVATDATARAELGRRAEISLAGIEDPRARRAILDAACQAAIARFSVTESAAEFQELSRVGIALMLEHNRKALLRQIVAQSKRLTHSDGGGLLLMSEDEDGRQWLRPVLYDFDSLEADFLDPAFRFEVNHMSMVGHAALIKEPVVVADVYHPPPDALYESKPEFDIQYGYRRRSMLVVPLIDQRNQVLGILLCINRKTDPDAKITSKEAADQYVIEYSNREVRMTRMLASQAAVAIENARLYAQVENMLESFVVASVNAIDLRDPATAGHSQRVAALATSLAEAVERRTDGPYRDVRFTPAQMRELRTAALLHDFGKVAVREELLLKAKKLPPRLWERIDSRFELIARSLELEACRSLNGARDDGDRSSRASEASRGIRTTSDNPALAAKLTELERYRDIVRTANEPSVLDAPTAEELQVIARRTYERPDGTDAPYLTPEELHYLQLAKGTLDARERAEVESHVTATREFLSNIPWTDDLKDMVTYAYGHHELLNGDGYPEHLAGDEIPLQTRLITIADIYDALTASDRPYKPSVAPEKALEILGAEAAAGRLDAELVKVMTESESYRTGTTPPPEA